MGVRKPLDPKCDGGIMCPVDGHLTAVRNGRTTRYGHIKLTQGQRDQLWERRKAEREAKKSEKSS